MRSLTLGILPAFAVPIRHIDRVAQKRFIHRHSVPFQQKEVRLVDVKGMDFPRPILNDPVLHVAFLHRDVGSRGHGIERRGSLPVHGDVKNGRTCGVVGILRLLGEIELSRPRRLDISQPFGFRMRQRGRRLRQAVRGFRRVGGGDNCGQGARRIVFAGRAGIKAAGDEACLRTHRRPFHDELHASGGRQ